MEKMKALYEKVAKDSKLQEQFIETMKDAEKVAEDAVIEKLMVFAKEAGYDVTPDEIQAFLKALSEKQKKELSDSELDMVAGGKMPSAYRNIKFY